MLNLIDASILLAFATLLGMAALNDFRSLVIPNRLCLAIVALYPAHVLASSTPVDWASGLMAGGVVFGIGTVMFALRLTGGGDVKLMAAAGVWAGLEMLPMMVLLVMAVGGCYSLFEAIRLKYPQRILRRLLKREQVRQTGGKDVVPYGVAISTGGLYVALTQFISSF